MRPSTHEFDPGPVHFNFVLDKVSLCKIVLWVIWFSPDSLTAPVLIVILLLSKGQVGEVWEPFNKAMLFRISWSTGQRSTSHLNVMSLSEGILPQEYLKEERRKEHVALGRGEGGRRRKVNE
jgi:hypothetical protein